MGLQIKNDWFKQRGCCIDVAVWSAESLWKAEKWCGFMKQLKTSFLSSVPGRRFFVELAGITNGAHQDVVTEFRKIGQYEVATLMESDYILLFCPIASRVGTDISEALERTSGVCSSLMSHWLLRVIRDIIAKMFFKGEILVSSFLQLWLRKEKLFHY